jgi:phosphatidate cytidylyltransferase
MLRAIGAWEELDMKKRILSTAILWTILVMTLECFGVFGCLILLVAASVLTQWEFYKLVQFAGYKPLVTLGIVCGIAMQLQCWHFQVANAGESFIIAAAIVACCALAKRSMAAIRESLVPTLLGIAYIPFTFTFSIVFADEMRILYEIPTTVALHTLLLLVAIAKFNDVGGIVFGRTFGKHKLAPNFSPNKTVEGFIGGVISSIAVGIAIFAVFKQFLVPGFTLPHIVLLSMLMSFMAVVGDLIESAIKRMAKIKDSGKILPGIGGIFDLTDSLILALPIGITYVKHIIV